MREIMEEGKDGEDLGPMRLNYRLKYDGRESTGRELGQLHAD
jgi:hypothetical protein